MLLTIIVICIAWTFTLGASAQEAWDAGAGDDWRKVVAAAKSEGNVVVAGHPALATVLPEAFRRDTGLTLEYLGGETNELMARFSREVQTSNVTIDIMLGGLGGFFELKKAGKLKPLKPQLLVPSVRDGKNWLGGAIKWYDLEGEYMLATCEWIHGWPLFSSDTIKPGQIATWQDLLKPEYKGKIAAYDPRPAGQGQSVGAYLAELFGPEFLKKLYLGQETVMTRDGRQLVEWVARGTYPIALGAVPVQIEQYRAQGIKSLYVRLMDDGPGSAVGGFGVVKQPTRSPHPNASTVFINWFASKVGQEIYAARMLEASRRSDVNVAAVPAYTMPDPTKTYLDQYSEEWYVKRRPIVQKQILEALGR